MGTHSDLRLNGRVIRYDSDRLDPMEPRLFDPAWLKAEGHHRGTSTGRGEAHFLRFGGLEMVLRPFRRGGLVGRANRDLYLSTGLEHSRSFREFELLAWMHGQGLPVPRPLAAEVRPVGAFYRAALLTERIADARPMEDILRQRALTTNVWGRAGATVRRLHDAGVYHSDLNCRNILLDGTHKVWLIDFDKCERRSPGDWTQQNLLRLKRSLEKSARLHPDLHWSGAEWNALLEGYEGKANDL